MGEVKVGPFDRMYWDMTEHREMSEVCNGTMNNRARIVAKEVKSESFSAQTTRLGKLRVKSGTLVSDSP
jgi:hypothetical protein